MKKSKESFRIGILGAGGVAKDLHLPALANMDEVSLQWICDKDKQRAQQLAELFRVPKVYQNIEHCSDVNIVLVAIPVGFRNQVMEVIFKKGWHAFCEKPFSVSLKECDHYLETAKKYNVQVGVALVRRYASATFMARKIVQAGVLGPVVRLWANEGMRTKRTGRESGFYMFEPGAVGGGILMETGSHLVDQICTILNVESYQIGNCLQKKYNGLELETRFVGTVSTNSQEKIDCYFEISRINDLCNGIFIQFRDSMLKCGLGFDAPLELFTKNGEFVTNIQATQVTENSAFALEWIDFIKQCQTGILSNVSAESARHSIAIIEQCYTKARIVSV